MEVLQLFLRELVKGRLPTLIVSIQRPRLGEVPSHSCNSFVDLDLDSAEIVKWVAESMRPFSIVEDDGFKMLMKTGRPDYYIPSRRTVARDVKHVFEKTRTTIAKMLQVRCQTNN
jgi:hypothetical protein